MLSRYFVSYTACIFFFILVSKELRKSYSELICGNGLATLKVADFYKTLERPRRASNRMLSFDLYGTHNSRSLAFKLVSLAFEWILFQIDGIGNYEVFVYLRNDWRIRSKPEKNERNRRQSVAKAFLERNFCKWLFKEYILLGNFTG